MHCPLCGAAGAMSRPSWRRPVDYAGRRFDYVRCPGCHSLFCHPMPDDDTLQQMYGTDYALAPASPLDIEDPRVDEWVIGDLPVTPPGLFVDYGCGAGELLRRARAAGWDVLGVELSASVAADVAEATGLDVVTPLELAPWHGKAAVVHLGDVVEHLAEPTDELAHVLALLAPGGLVVAQGPLEGNRSLFHLALRVTGWLRRRTPATFPPYHVLLATAAGQRRLFRRLGLDEQLWRVTEVSWPAPSRLHRADLADPRAVGLFALRTVSRLVSVVAPGDLGNRYLYRGRRTGAPAA